MKLSLPPQIILAALAVLAVLVVSNVVTGYMAAHLTRSQDFSELNMNCLTNWGSIGGEFDAVATAHWPHPYPQTEAQVYHRHEDEARFMVHYPKFNKRTSSNYNDDLTWIVFCWAVAAEKYHRHNVDIPVDPLVWQAFLAHGPKSLPLYWDLRKELTEAGTGQGLIRGDNSMRLYSDPKPPAYKMGRVSTPYQPLPGEDVPL